MRRDLSRRRTLQVLGSAAAVGVAGCGDNGALDGGGAGGSGSRASYSHLPAALTGELPDPEQYLPEDHRDSMRGYVDVRIDTEAGRMVVERQSPFVASGIGGVVLADELEMVDQWGVAEIDAETGEVEVGIFNAGKEVSFTPGTFEGFALRATASANVVVDGETVAERAGTVRYHVDEGRFSLFPTGGEEPSGDGVPAALRWDIPDPADRIAGRFEDKDRAVGRLYVDDTHNGDLSIQSYESETVTAVEGYVVADDVEPGSTWEGVADAYTNRIGTYVSTGHPGLSFSAGSFEGLAVRADSGIRLESPEEVLVEESTLLRYHPDEGVIERQ